MGMSPGFSLDALATNVDGLLSYVEVLISGTGNASVTGKPLGNKFFLKTTGKCSETTAEKWKKEREEDEAWENAYTEVGNKEGAKQITEDEATKLKNALNEQKKQRDEQRAKDKKIVDRWIYVNNIPDGSIPFIASGADGRTFNDLRGLIPGALGNLGALSPVQLFNGFTAGTYPDCAEVTLQTVDNDNVSRSERRHVALVEMVEMNPCQFPNKVNPASGKSCRNRDGFGDMDTAQKENKKEKSVDIYKYSLVSENGESVGIYEMGSLAGSSGVAYQTTHRSPLSYNIDITKSSPMSGLSFGKFSREGRETASEVIANHNANAGSFYDDELGETPVQSSSQSSQSPQSPSLYDELIQKLSSLLERTRGKNENQEDLSNIHGDTLSQVYYYGITAIMLYLLYKMLYRNNRK